MMTQSWLEEVAMPPFREIDTATAPLAAWYEDDGVTSYIQVL